MRDVRLYSRSAVGVLSAAGAALVAAFLLAPAALLRGTYGDFRGEAALRDAVGRGLVEYWRSGGPAFPALLQRLVDYWFLWHAIKIVISSLMLVVFGLLAASLWRRYLYGAARNAVGAVGATVFSVLAAGLLIANVQATTVPLVALLPLVDGGTSGGELAQTLREVREGLTESASPHAGSPALTELLGQVERYHWVIVAAAGTVMVATGLASAYVLWKRRVTADSRVSSMCRTLGIIMAVTATLMLALVAVSALSAIDPPDALLGILGMS